MGERKEPAGSVWLLHFGLRSDATLAEAFSNKCDSGLARSDSTKHG